MQHALFLDKPIRSNPRRRAQELDLSMLLSPPCETASPALSVPLTSTTEKSTTEHMAIDTFMTDHHWRTDTHSSSPASPTFPDQTLGQSSVTPGPSQQPKGRRKLTKAACSLCRQRKSKVRRRHAPSDLCPKLQALIPFLVRWQAPHLHLLPH